MGIMRPEQLEQARRINDVFMERMNIGTQTIDELKFLGLGIAEEGGEVAGQIKKMWRANKWHDPEEESKLRKEIADVLFYTQHLLDYLGVTSEEVIEEKMAELRTRWPEMFD